MIKKSTNNKCWKRCEKKGIPLHCWWESQVDNNMEVFQKKTKIKAAVWSNNSTPGHIRREKHSSKRHMYLNVHSNTFTIARTWKQAKCPATEKWIKKICYIYTMEYYSVRDVIWTQVSLAPKFLRTNFVLPKWGYFLKWSMFWKLSLW